MTSSKPQFPSRVLLAGALSAGARAIPQASLVLAAEAKSLEPRLWRAKN